MNISLINIKKHQQAFKTPFQSFISDIIKDSEQQKQCCLLGWWHPHRHANSPSAHNSILGRLSSQNKHIYKSHRWQSLCISNTARSDLTPWKPRWDSLRTQQVVSVRVCASVALMAVKSITVLSGEYSEQTLSSLLQTFNFCFPNGI